MKRRVLVALGWNAPRVLLAIGQHARASGWHLETRQFFTETVPARWRGDGMIVSNAQRADLLAFIRRQAPRQPTVLIGGNQPGIRAAQVTEDNLAAGRLAALHFIERGHRHFAWITAYGGPVSTDRARGFMQTVGEAGFACGSLVYPYGRKSLADWLSTELRRLPRPTACYVLDDQLAADVIEAALGLGWRVPEDLAVMGTGNIEIACECSLVPISSVELDEEELGRSACALLDRLMSGRKPPKAAIVIPPRGVVVRRSSDWLALTAPTLRRAVDFIHAGLHRPFSLEEAATAAGVSRRTLYHLFRRELRCTPAEFVLQARLARARDLLADPARRIAETAGLCGFGSPRTLTRVFLRHEGKTPRAWRARILAGPTATLP